MKRRRSTPPAAGRQARRDPEAAQEAQKKETPQERKDRILARAKDLIEQARKGEAPEEIIDKGLALVELKRIRPWRYDGSKGAFNEYVRTKVGYKPARAYDYIRVATNVRRDLVAGKLLTFETLLILADADAAKHEMLIEAALRGATARELRQLAFGEVVPDPNDPQERAERVVRLQERQATELQLLAEQMGKGAQVTSEVLDKIAKGGKLQQGLIAALVGNKGGDPGGGGGQELDPRGSNSGASGGEPPEARPAPTPEPRPAPGGPVTGERRGVDRKEGGGPKEEQTEIEDAHAPTNDGTEYTPIPVPDNPLPLVRRIPTPPTPPQPQLLPQRPLTHADVYNQVAEQARLRWERFCRGEDPDADDLLDDDTFGYDHVCCARKSPTQLGLIGASIDDHGHRHNIAINLDHPLALLFCGTPGSGKSYLLGILLELYVMWIRKLSDLQHARCAIVLSYHPSSSLGLEMMEAVRSNREPQEVQALTLFGALPQGIADILVLTIETRVDQVRREYPHVQVHALLFSCEDLGNQGLYILFGLHQTQSPLYMREVSALVRELWARRAKTGQKLTFDQIELAVETFDLSDDVRDLLGRRLKVARQWIDDSRSIRGYKKRGRVIQVDIRDEWLTEEEAMMLFALATEALVLREEEGGKERIPTVVLYDEAFKFAKYAPICKQMDTMVRQKRHLNTAILFGCQDPQPLPKTIIANLDGVGVFRNQSEEWLKYLGRHVEALKKLGPEDCAKLEDGEFWLWVAAWYTPDAEDPYYNDEEDESADPQWWADPDEPVAPAGPEKEELELDGTSLLKVQARARVSQHGGETKSAVDRKKK